MKNLFLLWTLLSSSLAFAVSYEQSFKGIPSEAYNDVASFPIVATDGALAVDKSTDAIYVYDLGSTSWVLATGGGGGGGVTSVSGVAPISSSGGATPAISIPKATSLVSGYLDNADWATFNAKEPAISAGTSLQYWRGDKTWQTLDTAAVPENTNLYYTDTRARNAISASAPLAYNTLTGVISLQAADATHDGYLTQADWATFNGKQAALGFTPEDVANKDTDGTLSANSDTKYPSQKAVKTYADTKQPAFTPGSVSSTTSGVSIANGANSTVGPNVTVDVLTATTTQDGLLSATDWNTFNNKEPAITGGSNLQYWRGDKTFQTLNTTVVPEGTNEYFTNARARAALSGTAPVSYDNTTGVISMPAAATAQDGYLTQADWNTFNGKQDAGLSWLKAGNAGTTPGTDFIGTTDAQDLEIRTNGALNTTFKSGGGIVANQFSDIAANATNSQYQFFNTITPTATQANSYSRALEATAAYDTGNAGFNTSGVSSVYGRWEHNGSGTVGFGSVFDGSAYFGANAGTTTLWKGLNLDHGLSGATVTSFYGISDTMNVGAGSTIGTAQMANFSVGVTDSTVGSLSGVNANPNINGSTTVSGGMNGIASGVSVQNTAAVTGGINGVNSYTQLENTSSSDYINGGVFGVTLQNSSSAQNITGVSSNVQVNNTASVSSTVKGAQVIVSSTPSVPSVTGVDVDISSANAPFNSRTGLAVQGGATNINFNTTFTSDPGYWQSHYIGGGITIPNGTPVSTFGFGINLAQSLNVNDDWSQDFASLGFNAVGFVGQVNVAAGKSLWSWTGALSGAGNASGSGSVTNAYMYKAAGILPQGGSVTVGSAYGFYSNPTLCTAATDCWSFYDDAGGENYLSKLAIGTTSKKVTNSDTALEIGGNKAFLNGSGTTAQRTALTAVAGMQFYDTDDNILYWHNGTSWVAAQAGAGAVTSVNGQTGVVVLDTDDVNEGTTNLYYTTGRFDTRFAAKSTTDLAEGSNLYFTNARAIAAPLTGYTSGAGTVAATDSVLQAIQKLNGNAAALSALVGTELQETPAGSVNNSNVTFTLANTPVAAVSVKLYRSGLILVQGTDYTISGSTITMATAPNFGQTLYANYRY